jgi:hypothetical protein
MSLFTIVTDPSETTDARQESGIQIQPITSSITERDIMKHVITNSGVAALVQWPLPVVF